MISLFPQRVTSTSSLWTLSVWTWPRGFSCIQRNAWSPVVHPVRQSTELYVDFTWQGTCRCVSTCLCDHEVPLVMSPVIQTTGWQIVHILVWPHLMLSFAYSGEPLPDHSMGIFASSPPGGVTPHSALPFPALPSLVKSLQYCLQQIIFHAVCAIIKRMVREPNRSTQTSSSFVVDNACGRKGSSNFGLFRIWYISIFQPSEFEVAHRSEFVLGRSRAEPKSPQF